MVRPGFGKDKIAKTKSKEEIPNIVKSHSSILIRKLLGVDIKLQETLKKLSIKPKNVVSAGQVTSNMEKRDSIFLRDTVFIKNLSLDTLFGDKWYKAQISLQYPSRIDLSVSMKSVKHIIVHNKKETINPPKKFWLWRIFQKKHTIQEYHTMPPAP